MNKHAKIGLWFLAIMVIGGCAIAGCVALDSPGAAVATAVLMNAAAFVVVLGK